MEKRSLGKMVLLSIVTLGIYQLYWLYKTRQELVALGHDVPPVKLLFAPLLGFVAVLVMQYVVRYFLASSPNANTMILNLIAILVGIASLFALFGVQLYWYFKYCQAAERVTHNQLTLGLSYGLFIVFSFVGVAFIWPFIVQSYFNQIGTAPTIPPHQPLQA